MRLGRTAEPELDKPERGERRGSSPSCRWTPQRARPPALPVARREQRGRGARRKMPARHERPGVLLDRLASAPRPRPSAASPRPSCPVAIPQSLRCHEQHGDRALVALARPPARRADRSRHGAPPGGRPIGGRRPLRCSPGAARASAACPLPARPPAPSSPAHPARRADRRSTPARSAPSRARPSRRRRPAATAARA